MDEKNPSFEPHKWDRKNLPIKWEDHLDSSIPSDLLKSMSEEDWQEVLEWNKRNLSLGKEI